MRVYYDFVIKELLKKAKKPELVKFTKEVLEEKISTAEKKEVFLKAVTDRVRDKRIAVEKYSEYFGWDLHDISSDLCDEDISFAIGMLGKKLRQLTYDKFMATTLDEKKNIHKHMGKLFAIRGDAFVKLLNEGRCSIIGIVDITSECRRAEPAYFDTVTGKKLNVQKYMLFPNMKYCKLPKKGKSLDLNNITFLGEYRAEDSVTTVNRHYLISFNGGECLLPNNYKKYLTVEVNEESLPIVPQESHKPTFSKDDMTIKASDFEVDESDYRKAMYILDRYLERNGKKFGKDKDKDNAKGKNMGKGKGKGKPKFKNKNGNKNKANPKAKDNSKANAKPQDTSKPKTNSQAKPKPKKKSPPKQNDSNQD